jgi:agmatinase
MSPFDPNAAAAPGSGLFGLDSNPRQAAVWVFSAPFDATASYRKGAHRAPQALLQASRQIDLYDAWTGRPYEQGIASMPADLRIERWNRQASPLADQVIAAGGNVRNSASLRAALQRVNDLSARVNAAVHQDFSKALSAGKLPVLIGGDHSTPYGAIQACAEHFGSIGVLHLDAHADLRVAFEGFEWSHASIMENVTRRLRGVKKLVQIGIRDFCEAELDLMRASRGRITALFDRDWGQARCQGRDLRAIVRAHLAKLPELVYLSFDVDGLDPALCPQTGTPVPGGLSWGETQLLLEELVHAGRRVVGLDLNEVNPGPGWKVGAPDSWDAIVGARLLYRMIATALATRG